MRAHLFDGTYELFRAWFGAPPAQHEGREVGATRAFVQSLARVLRSGAVTHGGVAFDTVIESFRNDLFLGYKTGEGLEPNLVAQFPLVERAAEALGLTAWRMIEFEADDAIATAAAHLAKDSRVEQVRIVAVDKDLCQSVIGTRVVAWDRYKDAILDEPGVIAKHGVPPESIPDLLGLVGDTADGIPGLEGWGKSSAAKVLTVWKHIQHIPDDAAKWNVAGLRGADRLATSLRDSRELAMLYQKLATLRTDCPIVCDLDALAWRGPNREALAALCAEIGLAPDSVRTS
ncbi:MAG TPA: 5'-3' exonuclease H3TH domain-containing protein [Kofleriaceae bacterium]|nr:5'-3' exonuclease H3TH domain-containing protein [Kofleriaceae bacterium]